MYVDVEVDVDMGRGVGVGMNVGVGVGVGFIVDGNVGMDMYCTCTGMCTTVRGSKCKHMYLTFTFVYIDATI